MPDTGYKNPSANSDVFAVVATSNTKGGTSCVSPGVALNMPSGITAGNLLLAICTNDNPGVTNMSISGWTQLFQTAYPSTTAIKHAVFAKYAVGGDTATLIGADQDYAAVTVRITGHGVRSGYLATDIKIGTTASGSDTLPNPPSLDTGVSRPWLWVECFGADDDDDTADYDSTEFSQVAQVQSANSTTSCLTAVGYKEYSGQTLNPTTMLMADIEEWLANTIAIPPAAFLNPTNAYSSNDSYATDQKINDYQVYYNFTDLYSTIPAGATIKGIYVGVEAIVTGSAGVDGDRIDVNLSISINAGSSYSTAKTQSFYLADIETVKVSGDSTDKWGLTLVKDSFSDANFRVKILFKTLTGSSETFNLDHLKVKVDYTEVTTNPVAQFMAGD